MISISSAAHSERTNSEGCHNDRKNGGYDCYGIISRVAKWQFEVGPITLLNLPKSSKASDPWMGGLHRWNALKG